MDIRASGPALDMQPAFQPGMGLNDEVWIARPLLQATAGRRSEDDKRDEKSG